MNVEPGAIAFANTLSSNGRDRIGTLAQWRSWIDEWPGLRPVGRRVTMDGLSTIQDVRKDIQAVLRGVAGHEPPATAALRRLTVLASSSTDSEIRWRSGRPTVVSGESGDPTPAIVHHLARMTIDLLLSGLFPLKLCTGEGCRKVFIASRPDRLWCDSTVCGNRSRVRAHRQKQRTRR
jgi:predicted RNA-binding Zn ribbon-like protein